MLVLGRKAQLLTEMSRILVDGEAWRGRGELEQDVLRLAEIDGVEVVAVDHRSWMHARVGDTLLPMHMVLVMRMPGDVVHGPGPRDPVPRRDVIAPMEVPLITIEAVLAVLELGEPERLRQQLAVGLEAPRDIGPGALNAEDGVLGGHLGMVGAQRRIVAVGDDQLKRSPS